VAFGNESGKRFRSAIRGQSDAPNAFRPGWSVGSIDAGNGSLQLRSGKQLVPPGSVRRALSKRSPAPRRWRCRPAPDPLRVVGMRLSNPPARRQLPAGAAGPGGRSRSRPPAPAGACQVVTELRWQQPQGMDAPFLPLLKVKAHRCGPASRGKGVATGMPAGERDS